MQEYGELDAKDYIPGAEVLEVEKEEKNAEDDEGSFLFHHYSGQNHSYYICIDLEIFILFGHSSSRCFLVMTMCHALLQALKVKWAWSCSERIYILV